MPKSYPIELRERVVSAMESEEMTLERASELFKVSPSAIWKWRDRFHKTGTVAALPPSRGRPRKFDNAQRAKVFELLRENPDATLEQLKEMSGIDVTIQHLSQVIISEGFALKKKRSSQLKPFVKIFR